MGEYTVEGIVLLDSISVVRKRPAMYVGDTSNGEGLHRLLWELVDEAVNEHVNGAASRIAIALEDEWVTVDDDGRGLAAVEESFTCLSAWHRTSVVGMGYTVVNALSRVLEVETHRDGRRYRMAFECGRPTTGLVDLGKTSRVGTRVRFTPDFDLFERRPWNLEQIRQRLWELACLTPGLAIVCNGEALRAPQGLAAWVNALRDLDSARPTMHVHGEHDGIRVEVALHLEGTGRHMGWANRHATPDGTHIDGFWTGVRDVFAPEMTRESARELFGPRVTAAVHVTLDEPRFATQTLERLDSPEAATAVAHVMRTHLLEASNG